MHGALAKDLAVDAVAGDGWDGTDHVGWVNELEVHRVTQVREVVLEGLAEEVADVSEDGVTAFVLLQHRLCSHQVLQG